ncbi:hypothetical protein [Caldiplasma sukawensis]
MKPVEYERPWIRDKLGLKVFTIVVVILFSTIGLLSLQNSFFGPTINIQSISVVTKVNNGAENSYIFDYGKFTYSGNSRISISFPLKFDASTGVITKIAVSDGFSVASYTSGIISSGQSVNVILISPDYNFFGNLNISITLS